MSALERDWRTMEHSWNESSVYCLIKERTVCVLSIHEEEATEENQAELEARMDADARLIAAAPEMHEALEAADVDLDLLIMAIKAGDPARELEIRASDIKRRLSSALSRVKG